MTTPSHIEVLKQLVGALEQCSVLLCHKRSTYRFPGENVGPCDECNNGRLDTIERPYAEALRAALKEIAAAHEPLPALHPADVELLRRVSLHLEGKLLYDVKWRLDHAQGAEKTGESR